MTTNPSQKAAINLLNYSLTANGLFIVYEKKDIETTIELAPFPTCELFKTLGIIEDYDRHGDEPVIIEEGKEGYEDEYGQQFRRTYQAWIYWNDFVKEYHLTKREAKIIAEHHAKDQYYKDRLSKIGLLEKQLKASA